MVRYHKIPEYQKDKLKFPEKFFLNIPKVTSDNGG